ncbi:MAG: ABC transporter ATP-binding protein/permease [Armatimonadetes bacterium]|nr:ABC transporter ATP-binding protein/permease [Armatimonadota bacterium]MDW8122317.1 ABC transporter ATP-binding protein [Armatimonadota bacterium]
MSYVEDIPPSLGRHLSSDGVQMAMEADLTPEGSFGSRWLIAQNGSVSVYSVDGDRVFLERTIALSDVKEIIAEPLIGGGAILVRKKDGTTDELIRYSNANAKKFGQAVKGLNDLLKGEPLAPWTAEREKCARCGFPLPFGSKVCPVCTPRGKTILRLLGYLKPYWWQAVLLSLLSITATAMGLVPPTLNKPLMDIVLAPKEPLPMETRLRWLALLVIALGLSRLLISAISIFQGWLSVWVGLRISHDIRTQLFQHLHLLSFRFFDRQQMGNVISRVNQDSGQVQGFLMWGVQDLAQNLLMLFGIGILLFALNWKLALIVLVPGPLIAALSMTFWPYIRSLMRRIWHRWGLLNTILSESLSGLRVVRAFAQEPREVNRFVSQSLELTRSAVAAERTWSIFFGSVSLMTSFGVLLVWYIGGRQVLGETLSLGTLITFLSLLMMFYGPLQFISWLLNFSSRSLTAAERLFEILDTPAEVKDPDDAVLLPRMEGRVEYDEVTFGYESHRPVLKKISFCVEPGEMIGLVGHSGAGKTTTINLLCRFYDADEGEIRLDGFPIKQIRLADLRRQIGLVPQDTFLFSGTIAENIAFGKPGASPEEIIAAAKVANAHDFIVTQKPEGYDTQVGERGQALSTGERQRVAIARALLPDPRIVILDEATSQVDVETEKQIQEAIERLIKGRTTFAIAHRLATLRNADRLIVLKEGKIVEIGTHDELLEKGGEFANLVKTYQDIVRIRAVAR